jgi:hypothetical protein
VEEGTLPGGHLSQCADKHRGRRELFEFSSWRKYPLKDLHWVVEHPERLSKRLLEQEDCQEGIIFSICGRRKEAKIPQGV